MPGTHTRQRVAQGRLWQVAALAHKGCLVKKALQSSSPGQEQSERVQASPGRLGGRLAPCAGVLPPGILLLSSLLLSGSLLARSLLLML